VLVGEPMFTPHAGADYDVCAWVVGLPSPLKRPRSETRLTRTSTLIRGHVVRPWLSAS
jgi:hypothetical protein